MAKSKRANGEGSLCKVYDKETGKVIKWRAVFTFGYKEDGTPDRRETRFNTQKEALAKLKEYQDMYNKGLRPTDENLTLQKWFSTWLYEYRINDSRPSTLERYDGIYRNYIKNSEIGVMKLKNLKTSNLQAFYKNLINNHNKTPDTIKTINKVLKCCLNQALKENYIYVNLCKNVVLPKVFAKREVEIFTQEEQKKFVSAIQNHKYKTLFLLALGTGLRLGELIALKWSDIDFQNEELNVQRTLKRVRKLSPTDEKKTEVIEQMPKTLAGIRTVNIPSVLIPELKSHQKKQREERLKNIDVYSNNNFVFCTELGHPIDSKNLTRSFAKVLKDIGIPHKKFHSLRHTFATRLFEENESPKLVSKLLGHSSVGITLDTYTHVLSEKKQNASEKINKFLVV